MFSNEREVLQFITSRDEETKSLRQALATQYAVLVSYYEGAHWVRNLMYPTGNSSTGRMYASNFRPDSGRMLVNDNEITKLTIKAAAATYPEKIYCDVYPPSWDGNVSTSRRVQVLENLLNLGIDQTGYLQARRDANHMRCIGGTWGIGLRITTSDSPVDVDGRQLPLKTRKIEAFDFDSTRLMLDPANRNRDLRKHDTVVYHDVISQQKIREMFGLDIPTEELTPIGQLAEVETRMSMFTEGRLYSRYRQWSQTPGCHFYQIHERGMDGRFTRCFYVLKTSRKEVIVNQDDPTSPFGGDGLPFIQLYGHRRGDTIWGLSDAALLKEGQDKRNTLLTLMFRHIQKHAGFNWVVDKRWFQQGHRANNEDIRNEISNAVGGVIMGGASNDRNVSAPTLLQTPPPQPFIMDLVNQLGASMRENVFRSEGMFGVTKSHVPDSSFQRAIEEAGQVLGIRVNEDITQGDEKLLPVLLGTMVDSVRGASPGTLIALRKEGFDDMDLGEIASTDPYYPACDIRVRESTARYKSADFKRQMLQTATELQAISPNEYRMSLAADLDTPTSDADRFFLSEIRKAVDILMRGGEYVPMSLGSYTEWAVKTLQTAQFDPRCKADPSLLERVKQAIIAQQQFAVAEQMALAPPAAGAGGEPASQPEQQPADPFDGLLSVLQSQGGGGGVPGQPASGAMPAMAG